MRKSANLLKSKILYAVNVALTTGLILGNSKNFSEFSFTVDHTVPYR